MIAPKLLKKIKTLGIKNGDIVCVASDISVFGIPDELREHTKKQGVQALLNSYIDTFYAALGPNGILVMPTFSYSACKNEIYDMKNTPSTVGALTETFRKKTGVERSKHPIFSFAALGKNAKSFLSFSSYDCFGQKSFFEKMANLNITYLFFGTKMSQGATFVYYAEQKYKVDYRYIKNFTGRIKVKGKIKKITVPYFVRDYETPYKDHWEKLEKETFKKGLGRVTKYNDVTLTAMKISPVIKLIGEKLKKDPHYLIDII